MRTEKRIEIFCPRQIHQIRRLRLCLAQQQDKREAPTLLRQLCHKQLTRNLCCGHTAIFLLHKLSKTSKWLTNLAHNLIFQYDRTVAVESKRSYESPRPITTYHNPPRAKTLITTSYHNPKNFLHELPRAKNWERPQTTSQKLIFLDQGSFSTDHVREICTSRSFLQSFPKIWYYLEKIKHFK